MKSAEARNQAVEGTSRKPPEDFRSLSIRLLHYANIGTSVVSFLRQLMKIILEFSSCDGVELRASDGDVFYRARATRRPRRSYSLGVSNHGDGADLDACTDKEQVFEELCRRVIEGQLDVSKPNITRNGSLWINDTEKPVTLGSEKEGDDEVTFICTTPEGYKAIALIPFVQEDQQVGLLELMSLEKFFFTESEVVLYESIAQTLGLAIADRRARYQCNERVKELTCLYGIAKVSGTRGLGLEQILRQIVELLPPAWQYPDITAGRITLDELSVSTAGFADTPQKQSSDIVIAGRKRGVVEVVYKEERPRLYEGPFLKEERSMIDAVAREVALIVERKEAEDYREALQEQLRHADRLATLGQLAAGVAHELNEPLSGILGFAQLAQKNPALPEEAGNDLDKIVKACLHAREVVKKLLYFARQMPTRKSFFDLNKLIKDGFYFLESRCAKQHIKIVRELDENLPEVYADSAQIHQVMVNLMVNAIQAMPEGGTMTIGTSAHDDYVLVTVEDTGLGMSEDVRRRAFEPFFTTKDIGEGTGLGLSVVHGILTSHGGSIGLWSEEGKGTRFEIKLPIKRGHENEEIEE